MSMLNNSSAENVLSAINNSLPLKAEVTLNKDSFEISLNTESPKLVHLILLMATIFSTIPTTDGEGGEVNKKDLLQIVESLSEALKQVNDRRVM